MDLEKISSPGRTPDEGLYEVLGQEIEEDRIYPLT
jgi:hypothetical protein